MISLTESQQRELMADARRVAAKKKLDTVVKRVKADVAVDGDALYYLTILPHYAKQLQTAYDRLNRIEDEIKKELVNKGDKNAKNKV